MVNNPPYQPPHPNAPMHPAIQYAPVPTKPEPTVVKIGTYLIYAVALYMIMRAIVGLDDFGFQTYHTENGETTEVNSSMDSAMSSVQFCCVYYSSRILLL